MSIFRHLFCIMLRRTSPRPGFHGVIASLTRIGISVFTALSMAAGVPALAAGPLAPHRAVYDIALGQASGRSGVTGVEGRMVYEFNGSPCEGYTVGFRFVARIDADGSSRITDQRTATHEDAAGTTFSFATRTYVDERLDREVRGAATLERGGTSVRLTRPDEASIELEETRFPVRHLSDLLERASRGEKFYETTVFDGSDNADQVMTTTIIVGKRGAGQPGDPEIAALGKLGGERFWPVSIAYFGQAANGGEQLPVYRMSFNLYPNGIMRSILMDYGDFALAGKLVDLSMFDRPADCG